MEYHENSIKQETKENTNVAKIRNGGKQRMGNIHIVENIRTKGDRHIKRPSGAKSENYSEVKNGRHLFFGRYNLKNK